MTAAVVVGGIAVGAGTAAVLRLGVPDGGDRVLGICVIGTVTLGLSSWSLAAVAAVALAMGTALVLTIATMGGDS